MKKIILFIAMSLDGYIADSKGSVSWLDPYNTEETLVLYQDFYDSIDTLIMGRKTYDQVINDLSPDSWPYSGKSCYVVTRDKNLISGNAQVLTGVDSSVLHRLKEEEGADIWLVGGGELIRHFIRENLIDEYIITLTPVLLGKGIPLFHPEDSSMTLKLDGADRLGDMVVLRYRK